MYEIWDRTSGTTHNFLSGTVHLEQPTTFYLGPYIWNNPQLSIWDRTSGTTHNFLSGTVHLEQPTTFYLGPYIWNNPQLSIWDRTSGTTHNFLSGTVHLEQPTTFYLGPYVWNNPQLSIWDRTSGTTHNFLSITDLNNLQQSPTISNNLQQSSVVYLCVKNKKPLNLVSNQQLLICHKCEFILKLFLLVPLEHSFMMEQQSDTQMRTYHLV